MGLASHDGYLYAVGGVSVNPLRSVVVFDGKSWEDGPELLTARSNFGLASHKGLLYAVGGNTDPSVLVSDGASPWIAGPSLEETNRRHFGLAVV